jgi:hypothetical protein
MSWREIDRNEMAECCQRYFLEKRSEVLFMSEKIKGYKGFDQNLKCQGFQYEVGKEYKHEGEVEYCNSGFHFCENPLDVFYYYAPASSRYCEVEGSGDIDRDSDDSKVTCSELKIGREVGLKELTEAGVNFILGKADWKNAKESNTGDQRAATATGDWGVATATGDQRAATATGDWGAATNTGSQSAATNIGNRSVAANTGVRSAATVEGQESVAVAIGYESMAKGALGCWLVLAEWDGDGEHIDDVQCRRVDGNGIKPDTFYKLCGGEFVEVVGSEADEARISHF